MIAPIAFALLLPQTVARAAPPRAAAPVPTIELRIDVGGQTTPGSLTDKIDLPLYQETKQITTTYPDKGGVFTSAAGRYRIWRQVTVEGGFTQSAHSGDAAITAAVPHPFFDNQPRTVQGTALSRHQETSIFGAVGWLQPLSERVHLAVSAGPAAVHVSQALVTDIKITEQYPYDMAAFARATVADSSGTAPGFFAAADLVWAFSPHVGAGGLFQITHATVSVKTGDRTVSVDAGGLQGGGGIRFMF